MPTNILMPALSPTMEEGGLAKWHVKAGDKVTAGDVIAEIETDKATMEVEAVDDGRIGSIVVPEGSQGVKVNAVIAVLLAEGESEAESAQADAPTAKEPAAKKSTAKKATSEKAGAAAEPAPAPEAAIETPKGSGSDGKSDRVGASPLARRLAREAGLDLSEVTGTGPHGRIVQSDVVGAGAGQLPDRSASPPETKASAPSSTAAPGPDRAVLAMSDKQVLALYAADSYEIRPHDSLRRVIARRLTESKQTVPHFYVTVDTEIDALLGLRSDINFAAPEGEDGKPRWRVSVNDMIIKALAMALKAVPQANVTWTEGGMLIHRHADVGVAVAIPGGLITPIVRRADEKPLAQISTEMKDFAKRARDRKLMPEEYQGGSSSISNLGMYAVREFAAVINPPQSSILAVGAGTQRPVVRDGKIEIATVMTVTLSTDHRAVDGATGAELLKAFRRNIEKPAGMLV